ncbi:MAG: death-on-curing protein [Bacteroidetes bacterium GWF2_42_66]|nr:MAG: death-on-curing protein [Bacteroidetes bacterium GWA2_42_15]OFX97110.1 MAG: death-on-curing protein [Bacteroidetes bacterium GWE2_42_39]OFY46181.1 MAG: death-on-curing protein [Bacteroidetes bacterium GWF2_42_66]HBL78053.1 type II toxin-antitoxin system death-on-curing family toxin [Prolixibacteraceae bacterium]HCU61337.1 type II toxin-antitoxin system death-on-curing family toxin [Prolixibacteraceae bacterium]
MSRIIYITDIQEIVDIHKKTIAISGGGAEGIIDIGSLDAALEHIQNDLYYPGFIDKLTHLFFVANKSHCFQDGNKRIAISIGCIFLLKNGYLDAAQRFLFKMETISYHLAAGRIEKNFLREIIDSIVYEEDYSEEIKLKLIHCITDESSNE